MDKFALICYILYEKVFFTTELLVFQVGNLITVTPPNSVHMLWLLPQYIIITAAEIMFSITGLEFSFTQVSSFMQKEAI